MNKHKNLYKRNGLIKNFEEKRKVHISNQKAKRSGVFDFRRITCFDDIVDLEVDEVKIQKICKNPKNKKEKDLKEKRPPFVVGIVKHKIYSPPFFHGSPINKKSLASQKSFAPRNYTFKAPKELKVNDLVSGSKETYELCTALPYSSTIKPMKVNKVTIEQKKDNSSNIPVSTEYENNVFLSTNNVFARSKNISIRKKNVIHVFKHNLSTLMSSPKDDAAALVQKYNNIIARKLQNKSCEDLTENKSVKVSNYVEELNRRENKYKQEEIFITLHRSSEDSAEEKTKNKTYISLPTNNTLDLEIADNSLIELKTADDVSKDDSSTTMKGLFKDSTADSVGQDSNKKNFKSSNEFDEELINNRSKSEFVDKTSTCTSKDMHADSLENNTTAGTYFIGRNNISSLENDQICNISLPTNNTLDQEVADNSLIELKTADDVSKDDSSTSMISSLDAGDFELKSRRGTTNEVEILSDLTEPKEQEIIDLVSDEEEDHAKILARVIATYALPNYVFTNADKLIKQQGSIKKLENVLDLESYKVTNTERNCNKCNISSKNEKSDNTLSHIDDNKINDITYDVKENHNVLLSKLNVAKSISDSVSPKFNKKKMHVASTKQIPKICFPPSPQLVLPEDDTSGTNVTVSPLRVLTLRSRKIHVSPSPKKFVQRRGKT